MIFYKIFEAAIRVIKDFGIKKAFSIEEILSCSLLFAIAVAGFKDITIFAYSLKNILISRASEAKLTPNITGGEIGEKSYIGE